MKDNKQEIEKLKKENFDVEDSMFGDGSRTVSVNIVFEDQEQAEQFILRLMNAESQTLQLREENKKKDWHIESLQDGYEKVIKELQKEKEGLAKECIKLCEYSGQSSKRYKDQLK